MKNPWKRNVVISISDEKRKKEREEGREGRKEERRKNIAAYLIKLTNISVQISSERYELEHGPPDWISRIWKKKNVYSTKITRTQLQKMPIFWVKSNWSIRLAIHNDIICNYFINISTPLPRQKLLSILFVDLIPGTKNFVTRSTHVHGDCDRRYRFEITARK